MEGTRKRRWLRAPSPAMIVACIALFVALGGTSYAAIKLPANSVGTKQIKKNAVTAVKVKSAAITDAKIKDAAITGAKIKDATITGAKIQDATLTAAKIANGAIDSAKLGTIPGARVRRVAAFALTTAASAYVPYDTIDFNVGGVFDPAQPTRMTAPVAGRYLIVASARWASDPSGRRTLALQLNGPAAQIARSNVSPYLNGGAAFSPEQTVQTVYKLNAGDYVEVLALQDSGNPTPLGLMVGVDNGVTFSMQWIAP